MKPRRLRDLGCKRTAVPTRVSTSISCENLRMRARIAPARGDVRTPPVISAPMTWARVAPAQGDGRIPSAISAPRTRARARIAPAPSAIPVGNSAPRSRARIASARGDGRVPSANSAPWTRARIASALGGGRIPSAISAPMTRAMMVLAWEDGRLPLVNSAPRTRSCRLPRQRGEGSTDPAGLPSTRDGGRNARQRLRRRLGQGNRKRSEWGVQCALINFAGFGAALPRKF